MKNQWLCGPRIRCTTYNYHIKHFITLELACLMYKVKVVRTFHGDICDFCAYLLRTRVGLKTVVLEKKTVTWIFSKRENFDKCQKRELFNCFEWKKGCF
jgi:hypothetical protein